MALIKCSECGKQISDKAFACPNCGCPVREAVNEQNSKNPRSVKSPYEEQPFIYSSKATAKKYKKRFCIFYGICLFISFFWMASSPFWGFLYFVFCAVMFISTLANTSYCEVYDTHVEGKSKKGGVEFTLRYDEIIKAERGSGVLIIYTKYTTYKVSPADMEAVSLINNRVMAKQ